MAEPRGTDQSLTSLTDDELREAVLSDWIQLTTVLGHELPSRLVSRLLRLELARGLEARATFVERLRGALMRARSRESHDALVNVAAAVLARRVPDWYHLNLTGLEETDIGKLQDTLWQAGFSRL